MPANIQTNFKTAKENGKKDSRPSLFYTWDKQDSLLFRSSADLGSHLVVLCAGDDFVLQLLSHVVKVVAVASNTNEQVAVVLRMLLGIEERLGVNDVELDVMTAELEVGADERGELFQVFVATQQVRHEAHVEQRASRLRLVEFA